MRREGRVRGRPTNKSRLTGSCRQGKTLCRSCREHPVEKARAKRRGRHKRFSVDVGTNPALAELNFVQPPPQLSLDGDNEPHEFVCFSSKAGDGGGAVALGAFTINSVIEDAFARKIHSGGGFEADEGAAMACTTRVEFAPIGEDILSALHTVQWGMFESGVVEGVNSLSLVRNRGCRLSEESWSDVEFSESSEQGSSVEDDWSMVDRDEDDDDV